MGNNAWGEEIAAWRTALAGAGYPATTLRTRTQHLYQLAAWARPRQLGPWNMTTQHLLEWGAEHDWKPESRHAVRSSLRSFYGWGLDRGRTDHNPAAGLPRVRRAEPSPRPVPERILNETLAKADTRERLMILLAAQCGLRRGEVAKVHADDISDDLTGWSLTVHGKGGKTRTVPLPDVLALEIIDHARGGYLFPGKVDGHLSAQRVGDLISALMPDGWTMHKLRHRFATLAYQVDRDLFTVQDLLGHANPTTTRRYVALPADAARRTVLAVAR